MGTIFHRGIDYFTGALCPSLSPNPQSAIPNSFCSLPSALCPLGFSPQACPVKFGDYFTGAKRSSSLPRGMPLTIPLGRSTPFALCPLPSSAFRPRNSEMRHALFAISYELSANARSCFSNESGVLFL